MHLVEPWLTNTAGDALALQFVNDGQKRLDFLVGQRSGWLVHDDQPRLLPHSARQMATNWRVAMGSVPTRASSGNEILSRSMTACACCRIAFGSAKRTGVWTWCPNAMFSATVRLGNSDRSW